MQHSIVEKLSNKFNLPEEQINDIVKNLWKNIKKDLSSGKGRDIRLKGFGKFYLDENFLYYKLSRYIRFNQKLEGMFRESQHRITHESWLLYIKTWGNVQKEIRDLTEILDKLNKRKKRVKGVRGL